MSTDSVPTFVPPRADVLPTTDTTTGSGNTPLLFSDGDLMSGVAALSANNNNDNVQLTNCEICFDPEANENAEQQQFTVDAQRIRNLINGTGNENGLYLGSNVYRQRELAQREVVGMGAAALPHLLQALNNNDTPLETRRRAEMAIRSITNGMTAEQLLNLRDPQQMEQLITNSLNGRPNANDMAQLARGINGAVDSQIGGRLMAPSWLDAMNYQSHWKLGGMPERPPTEETVRQWDRMATPEGRRAVADRLTELTGMLASGRLTDAERTTVANQVQELGRAIDPQRIAAERVNARLALAHTLQASGIPGSENRIGQLIIEAHGLTPANERGGIHKTILNMNLDQNPAFMQQFQAAGGDVQAIRDIRQMWEQNRNQKNNNGNAAPGAAPPAAARPAQPAQGGGN